MVDGDPALYRRAVAFWGNDVIAMMAEAIPGTPWFNETLRAFDRADVTGFDRRLAGADIMSVTLERGIPLLELAERLEVPYSVAYALDAGWMRLNTRGLFKVAERLGVPVGAFIHNKEFEPRMRARLFREFERHVQTIRHLQ